MNDYIKHYLNSINDRLHELWQLYHSEDIIMASGAFRKYCDKLQQWVDKFQEYLMETGVDVDNYVTPLTARRLVEAGYFDQERFNDIANFWLHYQA